MPTYLERAQEEGTEYGRNCGCWVVDGNTTRTTAQRIIAGYDDGDPEVMDMQPSPLSGEFADDPTPRTVLEGLGLSEDDPRAVDVLDAWELGFSEGYWEEVLSSARAIL